VGSSVCDRCSNLRGPSSKAGEGKCGVIHGPGSCDRGRYQFEPSEGVSEDNQQERRHATHDNQSTIQECIEILQIDTEYYMDTAIL
jgi:hypothetical protein